MWQRGASDLTSNAVQAHRCAKARSAAQRADMAMDVAKCTTAHQPHQVPMWQ